MHYKRVGLISFDVEEWFHILDTSSLPPTERWDNLCPRAPHNVDRILDLLRRANARATFFVVGWMAHRYPTMLRDICADGHEIASHSNTHAALNRLTQCEVMDELRAGKEILEDVIGVPVQGFRAPGFSVTPHNPWILDSIAEAGYLYDSSIMPARHAHGGQPGSPLEPYVITTPSGARLAEIPPSAVRVLGASIPFGGGGYLRALPLHVTRVCALAAAAHGRPFVSYVHPRDLDPESPRLALSPWRSFKCYMGVRTTSAKLQSLLRAFPTETYAHYLQQRNMLPERVAAGTR